MEDQQPLISLWAQPEFPRPYPIWPVPASVYSEEGEPLYIFPPEKIEFTPAPGILLPADEGHILHWIKGDILYTLVVEHDPLREATVDIARSLVER
jgi:hypothetical protein